ncbi:MAG: hypothetical protein JXO48_02290 [Deltaproteobacteria bacterium]|nr:hypothetical protein [Deltaproteobacteria bacterium]
MKRIIRLITGSFFVVLGIIGLFLPFLQGLAFIVIGLLLLAPDSRLIQRLKDELIRRYPGFSEKIRLRKVAGSFKGGVKE